EKLWMIRMMLVEKKGCVFDSRIERAIKLLNLLGKSKVYGYYPSYYYNEDIDSFNTWKPRDSSLLTELRGFDSILCRHLRRGIYAMLGHYLREVVLSLRGTGHIDRLIFINIDTVGERCYSG